MPVRVTQVRLVDRLYLVGPPGIGKTEIVRSLAEEEARRLGREFIDIEAVGVREAWERVSRSPRDYFVFYRIPATHMMPEDTGVPRLTGGGVVFEPPVVFRIFSQPGIAGVLFIDELSNVSREDVLTLLYALIQEKRFGWNTRLSDDVLIVAAGNRRLESSAARPLPAPLVSRLTVVEVTAPTPDEWIEYMSRRFTDWDRRVAAFLKTMPGFIYKPPSSPRLEAGNFPTPRSWTRLATEVYRRFGGDARPDNPVYAEYVVGTVGQEAGAEYLAFIKHSIPPVDDVLRDPSLYDRIKSPQARSLLLAAAASRGRGAYRLLAHLATTAPDDAILLLLMMSLEDAAEAVREMLRSGLRDAVRRLHETAKSHALLAARLIGSKML